jgi:hypothetical protein
MTEKVLSEKEQVEKILYSSIKIKWRAFGKNNVI